MTLDEIKEAVNNGFNVYWKNREYIVTVDKNDEWYIEHSNSHCIGLIWADGVTINGDEKDFYIGGW